MKPFRFLPEDLAAPLPPRGTRLLSAVVSEDVAFDFGTLPAPILALVESNTPDAFDVATDWLEENGRLAEAELLRHGFALFVNGRPALRWGLLRLDVGADEELQISGVGLSCMPFSIGETPRWTLLAVGQLVIVDPSGMSVRVRRSDVAKTIHFAISGTRATSVFPPPDARPARPKPRVRPEVEARMAAALQRFTEQHR